MHLITFDDMKKTSVFFILKPVNAIYGFIVTLCIIIITSIVWLIFAPMDDVVKANALLRPTQAVSSVRCVSSGELSIKNYKNNAIINEGELLFALDTTSYKTEKDAYLKELEKNKEDIYMTNILLQVIESSELPNIRKETDAYIKATAYLTEKKKYENSLVDIQTKLDRECSKPESMLLPQNIQDLQNQLEQYNLSYESWLTNQKLETLEKKKELENSKKTIETHISEIERYIKNSTIYAPISGKINEITKLNEGDYILAGEEVLRIIPQDDTTLKADIYVDSSYIARIRIGNSVKIKFPGLAPSRYGMIDTIVSLVPPDATITQDGQAIFIIEAPINNPYLTTKKGDVAKLLPGISAEARIITERSTAMQMILRKLDFIN